MLAMCDYKFYVSMHGRDPIYANHDIRLISSLSGHKEDKKVCSKLGTTNSTTRLSLVEIKELFEMCSGFYFTQSYMDTPTFLFKGRV